jgi:hypothetical protein
MHLQQDAVALSPASGMRNMRLPSRNAKTLSLSSLSLNWIALTMKASSSLGAVMPALREIDHQKYRMTDYSAAF